MMMTIDLPRLSTAEKLLWSYGVTEPKHIDLEGIANDNGAEVRFRHLEGCEARLVAYGERAVISINSASSHGRRRFSLAHEIAHWNCDRKAGSFLCAKEDIGPQNAEAKSVEAYANSYASQLILPDYLARPWMEGKRITLDLTLALAKDFNSSLTAAAIKLTKNSSTPACLACHGQSRLVWFQKNITFPMGMYVTRELHQDTDAFEIAFGVATGMTRVRREPANRWFSGREAYRLTVESQSFKLPDGTVLTLITLPK